MAKPVYLMAGAFLFSAGASYIYIHSRPAAGAVHAQSVVNPESPHQQPSPEPPPKAETIPTAVASYKPPKDRSPEMQVFDKAVLFLSAMQEGDGHWSAAKSGATPEFTNANGDITLTALLTATLLDACSFKESNPAALAHARKGLDWLSARIRADGGIADESAPGEPVAAQLNSALTFLQALDLSSRETVRQNCAKLCRYAVFAMEAEPGGFGATKNAKATRSDLTALATIMFNQARAAEVQFHEPKGGTDQAESKLEGAAARKIEQSIRKALDALRCPPRSNGTFARSSDKLEPSWAATVDAQLVAAAFAIQGPEVDAGFDFILGAFYDPADPGKTISFPGFERHVKWGEHGEGFSAPALHNASWLFYYVYGPNQPIWQAWGKAVTDVLLPHALPDGSFAAAGSDTKLGRFARTAICARVLAILAPPIPAPPPQTANPPQPPPAK